MYTENLLFIYVFYCRIAQPFNCVNQLGKKIYEPYYKKINMKPREQIESLVRVAFF